MEKRSKKREKNILMTTMSTLKPIRTVNYYFSSEMPGTRVLFCDGISAVENGSKYILSKYPIDEILVVGSEETFIEESDKANEKVENLLKESSWEAVYDEWENKYQRGSKWGEIKGTLSAFGFYKLRMAEFVHQKNVISEEVIFQSVSEESRRERIREIAQNTLKDMAEGEGVEAEELDEYAGQCLQEPEKSMELLRNMRRQISEDIEKSFEKEDGYLQYMQQKRELFSRRVEAALKSQEYQKAREDIENDQSLSLFEKEFLFVSLQRKMDSLYFAKEKSDMMAETEELRKENAKLQYQIQNLRNQRSEKELAFAKYTIYQGLGDTYKIKPNAGMPEKLSMQFIPEKINGSDNITAIVNAIYNMGMGEADGEDAGCINLYVDMQGGSRTSGYVRNAVLSILNNQATNRIRVKEIVATDFNVQKSWVSEIVNETNRYRIHDFVSGMNAFIRYGKADMLVKYCEDMREDEKSRTKQLVEGMRAVDHAISLCDPSGLEIGIRNLIRIIRNKDGAESNYVSNLFQAMEDGIERDYRKFLLESKKSLRVDYVKLVEWCREKKLIQQALTIIEDKMPGEILKNFIRIDDSKVTVNGKTMKPNDKQRTAKLSKVLGYGYGHVGKENVLFYGLTRKIAQLWDRDYENRCSAKAGKRLLEKYEGEKPIADEYCRYMLGNWTPNPDDNSYMSDIRQSLGKPMCDQQGKPYKTLASLEAGEHIFTCKDSKLDKIKAVLDVRFKVSSKRQQLEELLTLHAALKEARNQSNHASEKEARLSLEIVSKAIEEYLEKYYSIIGEKKGE